MAEEKKQTSNVIRPEPTKNLPSEKEGDFKSFIESLYTNESVVESIHKTVDDLLKSTVEISNNTNKSVNNLNTINESILSLKDNLNNSDDNDNLNLLKSIDKRIENIYLNLENKPKDEAEDEADRRESVDKVSIYSFSEDALKQLNLKAGDGKNDKKGDKKDDKNLDFLRKVLEAAVPLIMAGGAFIASIGEMFKGGPLHGLGTLFAKGSVAAAFLALKGVGINVLGKLPIVGGIISIGSGILRLTRGDFFGGMVDFISGLLYFTPLWPLGVALDLFNMAVDMGETNPDALSGWAGKAVQAKTAISNFFKTHGRNLPIVGTVIRLGEAIGYFSAGQIQAGFKSMASVIPALWGGGMVFDWLFGAADPWAEDGSNKGAMHNIGKILRDFIAQRILQYVPNVWGLRSRLARLLGVTYNEATGEWVDTKDDYEFLKAEQYFTQQRVRDLQQKQQEQGLNRSERRELNQGISRSLEIGRQLDSEQFLDQRQEERSERQRLGDMILEEQVATKLSLDVNDPKREAIMDNLYHEGFTKEEIQTMIELMKQQTELQREALERAQTNPTIISSNSNMGGVTINHDPKPQIPKQRLSTLGYAGVGGSMMGMGMF